MKKSFLLGLGLLGSVSLFAQSNNYWSLLSTKIDESQKIYKASKSFDVKLDETTIKSILKNAGKSVDQAVVLNIPTPEGTYQAFLVWENSLLPEVLAAKYPNIRSYTAISKDGKQVSAKIEMTELGFYAMIYNGDKTFVVNPLNDNRTAYTAFYKNDYARDLSTSKACLVNTDADLVNGAQPVQIENNDNNQQRTHGALKRTYRLALAGTGEYGLAVGGPNPSVATVLSAMTTSINRVNGVYEKEIAITLQFVDNQDTLAFFNPATDPYTLNNNVSGSLLSQNQSVINTYIGSANYDIGHVFATGEGGIASFQSVCRSYKAQGATGRSTPVGDPFDIDYVSHEMGHQLGGNHTFNICSGTENQSTAYEPGGGTTIMAYAGICASVNNVQQNSDAYFHSASLREISTYLNNTSNGGGSCGVTETGLTPPSFTDQFQTYYVPISTPFILPYPTVTASNGGVITSNIEQKDRGNYQMNENLSETFTAGPTFRSLWSDTATERVFPLMSKLNAGLATGGKGERLSSVTRDLKFSFNTREVLNGWGSFFISEDVATVKVTDNGGAFKVIYPSNNDSIIKNSQTQIIWNVGGSDLAPISCSNINIYLSVDGGLTYPYTLAQNVANNGSAMVTIPNIETVNGKIKIESINNIFFNISLRDFVIGTTATIPPDSNSTSIGDIESEKMYVVYPNPATDVLNIAFNQGTKGSLTIYNTLGQKMWSESIQTNSKSIQVNSWSKGMYILNFTADNGKNFTKRIIIK